MAVFGMYQVSETDFNEKRQNVEIKIRLLITEEIGVCFTSWEK